MSYLFRTVVMVRMVETDRIDLCSPTSALIYSDALEDESLGLDRRSCRNLRESELLVEVRRDLLEDIDLVTLGIVDEDGGTVGHRLLD